jgi:hypothetical protein
MLKDKKLEYQQVLEEYLEQKKLYELFEGLMKALIVSKPSDPIDFLIKKLQQPESKHLYSLGKVNGFVYSDEDCVVKTARL